MREIELKIDGPQWFDILENRKRVEVRRDDRPFDVGVVLVLRETTFSSAEMADGAPLTYTGRKCFRLVTHCLRGEHYGVREGFVAMSVRPLTHAEKDTTL